MSEFKHVLFDSSRFTRSNDGAGCTTPTSPAGPPSGAEFPFLQQAATAGTSASRTLPQRAIDSCELEHKQLEKFAFGESTRTPEAVELLPHPPYKLHVVPYHRSGVMVFVQLVLSTICYWEQSVADPRLGPDGVSTRTRKVAVCLVVTCYEQRDYALFMANVGFLRGLLHRTLAPSVELLKRFFGSVALQAREQDRRRLLDELQQDAACAEVSRQLRAHFAAFLETRLLVPALSALPVCMPNVLKSMISRPPTLRVTNTATMVGGAAGAGGSVALGYPKLSDSALREALIEMKNFGAEFLAKVIAGCISISNIASFQVHGDVPRHRSTGGGGAAAAASTATHSSSSPSSSTRYLERHRSENVGRIVIVTKDVGRAKHLMTICAFFFKRDRTTCLEQSTNALLAHEAMPRLEQGDPSSDYSYRDMMFPPLYAAWSSSPVAAPPILWHAADTVDSIFESLVDPYATETALLIVQPLRQSVQRLQIQRSFRVREGTFQISATPEDMVESPVMADAVGRALRSPHMPLLRLLQDEVEFVFRQSRAYHAMVQAGYLPGWHELHAMYLAHTAPGSGHSPHHNHQPPTSTSLHSARSGLGMQQAPPTDRSDRGSATITTTALSSQRSDGGTSAHSDVEEAPTREGLNFAILLRVLSPVGSPTIPHTHVQLLWLLTQRPTVHIPLNSQARASLQR